jgi:hypothetical protein
VPDPHRDLLRRELADMEVATQDELLLGQGELSGEAERQRRAPARMQRLRGGCPARGEQGVLVHGDDVSVLKLLDPRRLGGRVIGAARVEDALKLGVLMLSTGLRVGRGSQSPGNGPRDMTVR